MENKFKKGLILGSVLAIGSAVGFALTKEGKELTKELQTDLKGLAKHLKKNLFHLEDVTKEHFDELVVSIVDEYAKKKKLAKETKQKLEAALQSMWQEMLHELEEKK